MKNNDATKRGVKRCDASLKRNLQWDEVSGDRPCRILKEPAIQEKEKLLQMASGVLPSTTASLTL